MEVYVNDMVVKSMAVETHVRDLEEVFAQIQKYNIRLNLKKCVFGAKGWKSLLKFKSTTSG